MKSILNKISSKIKIAPMQSTLIGLNLSLGTLMGLDVIKNYYDGDFIIGTTEIALSLINYKIYQIQKNSAKKRINEYKKVKRILKKRGWDERIIEKKMHSWCQRYATQIASNEVGYGEQTKNYFYEKGYRWYHFLPD